MMTITINKKETEFCYGETIIEVAHRMKIDIPALCYAKGKAHKPSCMICSVKDCRTGNIIPSCATIATDGMVIDTESEEVLQTRRISLELLLSDHRADCEAPCTLVCPYELDVAKVIYYTDINVVHKAIELVAEAFTLPNVKCNSCKAPCEKACRRGTVDKPVDIRNIIMTVANSSSFPKPEVTNNNRKDMFKSRLGRFTEAEKMQLKSAVRTQSRCLHCTCEAQDNCKLRCYASQAGIKRSRYDSSSVQQALNRQAIGDQLVFESAKCIKCGLCVYNSDNGFTFKSRGFRMEVFMPQENICNIDPRIAAICPTGALYKTNSQSDFQSKKESL